MTGRGRLPLAESLLVGIAVAGLRLATAAPDTGGVSPDTGNYLLALQDFSLELGRPHLPGSWLLVVVLRGLAGWLGPHGALLSLTIVLSAVGAGLVHALLRQWLPATDARLTSAVLVTQPLVWFYGTVPEIYAFDLCFGAAAVTLGLGRRGLGWLPVLFAVGAILRPTTPLLLLPLYGWLWWRGWRADRVRRRTLLLAHLAAAVLLVAGLWPLIAAAGGLATYAGLFRTHVTVDWSLARNLFGLTLFAATLLGLLGVLLVARCLAGRPRRPSLGRDTRLTLWIWLLPAASFFVLGHHQKGYALLIVVPLVVLAAMAIADRWRRPLLLVLVLVQTAFFLMAPYQLPPPEIHLAPRVRTLSLPEVWWHRAWSTHLMARSMPRALAAAQEEVAAILAAAPGDTLLLDPTVPLFLRAVQVKHPDRAFAVLEVHRRDGWRLHAGLDERTGEDVAALLARTVLVTRAEFAAAHLDDLASETVRTGGGFNALRLDPGAAAVAASRYADLCERLSLSR